MEFSKKIMRLKGNKITISYPRQGKNKRLVELANRNAASLFENQSEGQTSLRELKEILMLSSLPSFIEGYDVSNTGGEESVGSLAVFKDGAPCKQAYRKYKIKTVQGPNDIASLKEVIHRRFAKLKKKGGTFPNLVLVDGGKGQLKAAKSTLDELGLEDVPVISLAKKEEIIFSDRHRQGLRLDRTSSALLLLQNIRDEAHRFALSYHRQQRSKKSFTSILDNIPGIGPQRKKNLLTHYRSIKDIQNAPLSELTSLIGSKAAKTLIACLKPNDKEV
jgi:excinuclease ABC subunit C